MNKSGIEKGTYKGFYSVIAENYHKLSKEQLRDIIKELDYATANITLPAEYNQIIKATTYELLDQESIEY